MTIPTYEKFIEPTLRYLARFPGGAPARDVHDAAAAALNLTEADKALLLASGAQLVYKNRAGWAHDRLKRAGLSTSPSRGVWRLTADGLKFAASHPGPLTTGEVERLAMDFKDVRLRVAPGTESLGSPELLAAPTAPSVGSSPDDRLSDAVTELRRTVAAELLDALGICSPSYFERIVLDLLHRMGYGTSRADVHHVGGVGDGGIDGVISLDKLGLEKVYIQAKRWTGTVGGPEVQAFYGALAGQHAKKGVMITTSSYTRQAVEFARKVDGVVLVDGVRLAELMIDHEVGVSVQAVKIPKLDTDYFDENTN